MTSTFDKIRSGTRMLVDADLWRIILREARRGKRKWEDVAEATIVETDESSGLHRVGIGGYSYWVPQSMGIAGFQMIYLEVFCEDHPHYYEYRGCRIRPGDVVVDAGACEGLFTRIALERGARVIAVEPWGPMAEGLRRTFEAEIAAGTVIIAQTLLHDQVGAATLRVNTVSPWGASMYDGGAIASGEVREAVSGTTLDELVTSSPWGRCDFVKMDIEGVERKAVAGARATIVRDLPCLSIAVYHHATGYLDIRHDLQSLDLGYEITGKGLQRRGLYFPMIMHAWPPSHRRA
jgi:FkbM family methyltransferase